MRKILLVLLMLTLPCTSFGAEAIMPGANFWKSAAKSAATAYGVSKLPNKAAKAAAVGVLGLNLKKEYDKKHAVLLTDIQIREKILLLAECAHKIAEKERNEKGEKCAIADLHKFMISPNFFKSFTKSNLIAFRRQEERTVFADVESYYELKERNKDSERYFRDTSKRKVSTSKALSKNSKAIKITSLDMDHIPSQEAVFQFFLKKGITIQKNEIKNNLTAIALPRTIHQGGATYGRKNLSLAKTDAIDGEALRRATIRDLEAEAIFIRDRYMDRDILHEYLVAAGLLLIRNEQLCLYQ